MSCEPVTSCVKVVGYGYTSQRHLPISPKTFTKKGFRLPSVAGRFRPRWIRKLLSTWKESPRSSRFLASISRSHSPRFADRAHLPQPSLCKSTAFEAGNCQGKCVTKQRFTSCYQCTENALQGRPSLRQDLPVKAGNGSLLLHLSASQEQTLAREL